LGDGADLAGGLFVVDARPQDSTSDRVAEAIEFRHGPTLAPHPVLSQS
jgi:hypothetical protein